MKQSFEKWLEENTVEPYCTKCESEENVLKLKVGANYCLDCLRKRYESETMSVNDGDIKTLLK